MAAETVEPELPEEVIDSLESFHEALGKVEDVLKPLMETPVDDLKAKMNPLENAKLDLVVAYAINSMFWMYLTTQGVNPRHHPVKSELDRIKKYMCKVKEATEKREALIRIDKSVADRFVKSALWEPSDKEEKGKDKEPELPSSEKDSEKRLEKRKIEGKSTKSSEKKKKKKA